MARTPSLFDLPGVYREATLLIRKAECALRRGDAREAYKLPAGRVMLTRSIQRCSTSPAPWGTQQELDAAAMDYLEADRELEAAVRCHPDDLCS